MRLTAFLAAASAALAISGTAAAATTTIDFSGDAAGVKAEGFVSSGYGGLAFFTDLGAGIEVGDYSPQSSGKGLLVRNDSNGNFLVGVFNDGGHTFMSLDFGNDDPFFTTVADRAVLTVYLGGVQVGQTIMALNRNDILDQTISFNGGLFDNFTFAYLNAAGGPFTGGPGTNVGLIEVVDNVTFGVVPEPSTWAMMILGVGGIGALLRRRRSLAFA